MSENTDRARRTLENYAKAGHTGPVTFHFVQGGVRDVRETRECPSQFWSSPQAQHGQKGAKP